MKDAYRQQVSLLLNILPEVAKESCFALHGGTAINLFIQNMPRLSVDIDLTYTVIADRDETLHGINAALLRIKKRVECLRESIRVQHKFNICKLLVGEQGALTKIEVNIVGRGLIGKAIKMPLCETAQEQFDAFCMMPIVPLPQLYGGKLCAALDRQHPRDIFDVKLLLERERFTNDMKRGFLYSLISSNRPTHEMLAPNLLDQRIAFENQFEGMSDLEFSYADYEATRMEIIRIIRASLSTKDRAFLLSLNRLQPDWTVYDFQQFPSVKWKLLNLAKFKEANPDIYNTQLDALAKQMK